MYELNEEEFNKHLLTMGISEESIQGGTITIPFTLLSKIFMDGVSYGRSLDTMKTKWKPPIEATEKPVEATEKKGE